jgi:nucleoside-diphosphate-sugar epimerase/quercetin dioxygenase-like cupin family protein
MEKVLITGGLGYIGTELCKLYSGESRFKQITVLDNRFVSERVNQLRSWGIDFIHGDILDENLIGDLVSKADLVYHLAGITDVAYTKTEANSEKDKLINQVGVVGTKNVIQFSSKNTKIVFPSTHVVFEGLEETKFDIDEEEQAKPILSYSLSKEQSERDLIDSNKNYVIVRLATVVGYSHDTMRINIMPNLFSKIASQNGTIKLFSGGLQHKSLVSVFDVARCMKFLGESENINKEIFHCSQVNTTVKEVAEICKEYNPSVKIIETKDEIPNLGYTILSQKLLNEGFEFKYDVKLSIQEMIKNWSKKDKFIDLEMIQKGQKEYIDDRGKISNYELTEPINLIGYIESKKGTVRANHYHPVQEQKCLLVKGQYISVLKDLSTPDAVLQTNIINAGDLAVIHPNVAHTMVFLEDSIFLNLVRGEREHENYGITHTMPYQLVDESLRKLIVNHYKANCRVCKSINLKQIISLGISPLANNLPKREDEEEDMYPLELNYCPSCFNCQLSFVVPPTKMFDEYLYVSSTSAVFRKHFSDFASELISNYELDKNSLVVDIGSNDGVFLQPLKEKGINVIGVDPAANLCSIANQNGINTIHGYFDTNVVNQILKENEKADVVTAFNVFAHADNLTNIALDAFALLKSNGSFIIEVQYLLNTIKDLTFDNIYHEHVNYWSVLALNTFFENLELQVFKIEHVNTHGGSIRVYIRRKSEESIHSSVQQFIKEEEKFGLNNFDVYKVFSDKVQSLKVETLRKINNLKKENKSIVGYGSPAKATTVLNYYGISNDHIDYIIEDNKLKHNHFLPGMKIPICSVEKALDNPPDYILVLAWNFFENIKENNQKLVDAGTKFITLKNLDW